MLQAKLSQYPFSVTCILVCLFLTRISKLLGSSAPFARYMIQCSPRRQSRPPIVLCSTESRRPFLIS